MVAEVIGLAVVGGAAWAAESDSENDSALFSII